MQSKEQFVSVGLEQTKQASSADLIVYLTFLRFFPRGYLAKQAVVCSCFY